jgi:redox-sensitive bicupin YhaK (pirin superfamily)
LSNITSKNQLSQVLSPSKDDQGVWIHQDAWFHIGEYNKETCESYVLKKAGNGIYAFILEGSVTINDQVLGKRDGFGVWDTEKIELKSTSGSKFMLMEVPMVV